MRADERLACELVERARQPLRETAAVDEDQRGLMLPDEIEEARMNRRPDRRPAAPGLSRGPAGDVRRGDRGPGHVLDRDLDAQRELLAFRRVHDRYRPERGRLRGVAGELVLQLRLDIFERHASAPLPAVRPGAAARPTPLG